VVSDGGADLTGNYIRVLTEAPPSLISRTPSPPSTSRHAFPGALLGSVPGVTTTGIAEEPRRGAKSLPIVSDG
jgi:hypothetical protein